MEEVNKKFEANTIFWVILGPLFLILTSLFTQIRGEEQTYYLSFIASTCLPVCYFWKLRGLAASIGLLLLSLILSFQIVEITDPFWTLATAAALSLALVIFTLSLEEVLTLFRALKEQGSRRLDQLLQVDEKWHKQIQVLKEQKEHLQTASYENETKSLQLKEQLDTSNKLNKTLHLESKHLHQENQALVQQIEHLQRTLKVVPADSTQEEEFLDRIHTLTHRLEEKEGSLALQVKKIDALERLIEEKKTTLLQTFQTLQQEKNTTEELKATFLNKEKAYAQELQERTHKLHKLQEQHQHSIQQLDQIRKEASEKKETLLQQSEKLKSLETTCEELRQEQQTTKKEAAAAIQKRIDQLNTIRCKVFEEQLATLAVKNLPTKILKETKKVKQANTPAPSPHTPSEWENAFKEKERAYRQLQGLHKQLRQQFEEKSDAIHKTRSDLFHLEGKLEALELEEGSENDALQRQLDQMMHAIVSESQEKETLHKELKALESLVTALI